MINKGRVAIGLIMLIPLLWGIGFPLTKNGLEIIEPGMFAFYRSSIAALSLSFYVVFVIRKINSSALLMGMKLSLFYAINYLAQAYALSQLTSATSAFCISLNVIMVPFILFIFRMGTPGRSDIVAILCAVIGCYITLGGNFSHLSSGYLYGLLAALSIAVNICLVSALMRKNPNSDKIEMTFYQVFFGAILLSYYPLNKGGLFYADTEVWVAILYMGCIATAFTTVLQAKYQNEVGSTRMSLIFNFDLVYASLFGLINKEPIFMHQAIGGVFILFGGFTHSIENMIKRGKR